jgi:hypothetical protein
MILAATGHRPPGLWPRSRSGLNFSAFTDASGDTVTGFAEVCLREMQPDEVISGMAQGWDMAVARAAVRLGIPFDAYIPFKGQEEIWPGRAQAAYRDLLALARSVVVCSPFKLNIAFLRRDERMVDDADEILALWDGSDGGTGHTVRYAEEWAPLKPLTNVWPQWERYREEGK